MRRAIPIPIHPLLFAAFPILSLYSANLGIFSLDDLFMPLVRVIGLTSVIWVLIAFLTRSVRKGAVGATLFVIGIVVYIQVIHGSLNSALVFLWVLACFAVGVFVAFKWKGTAVLNVIGSFLVLTSLGSIALRTYRVQPHSTRGYLPIVGSSATAESPDVYYIILDGYGRHDSLKQFIDYDNETFLDGLRKRGFFVADQSHSNYVQTEISIPSSLNMNFVQTLLPNEDPEESERVSLDHLAKNNEASRQFGGRGYKTTLVTSGFPIFDHVEANYLYKAKKAETLMESTLTQSSPLANKRADDAMYTQRREQLLTAFQEVGTMAGRRAAPRFVFAHILAPHPPFVFDAQGRPIRPPYDFGLWDGSDFMHAGMKSQSYQIGYAAFVQTIDRLTLKMVDEVLSKPGPRPVIILQGDHGSKRFLDQNELSKTDVRECFSNLFAISAPAAVMKGVYPSMTPVNELRAVLNGLFDAKLPMLADKSWYSAYEKPYKFVDVTDAVDKYAAH